MDAQHWHDRWEQNQIGFHQDSINAHLESFWTESGAAPGCSVFVPLCGKSLDMLWLRSQGHPVLGIELSRKAVADFFSENRLQAEVDQQGLFERWRCDGLTLLVGDFFNLQAADLQQIGGVYDRASLIALPPAMRQEYAHHMGHLVPPGVGTLLISMEYPQDQMDGPPFSVAQEEVEALYGEHFGVELLHDLDVLEENPRFRERGLSRMHEKIYRLR